MAKKRKAGGHSSARSLSKELGSSKRTINTYEDVADSGDEFHMNRDKILLDEGPVRKRQRKIREEDAFLEFSDEEVLAEYDEEEDETDDEETDDEESKDELVPGGMVTNTKPASGVKASRERRGSGSEESQPQEDDEEDASGWGTSKKEYYNADVIETEADALEEEVEAIRLQKKHLQAMTEADFGFDETEWLDNGRSDEVDDGSEGDGVVMERLPHIEVTEAMGVEEKGKIMNLRYPEFGPLAKEFLDLQAVHEDLRMGASAADAVREYQARKLHRNSILKSSTDITPVVTVKHNALSAYLGSLAMYFALLTSGPVTNGGSNTAKPPAELREHPIMQTLIQCRNLWEKVKALQQPELDTDKAEDIGHEARSAAHINLQSSPPKGMDNAGNVKNIQLKVKRVRKNTVALDKKTALKAQRACKTEKEFLELSESLLANQSNRDSNTTPNTRAVNDDEEGSDFGEDDVLTSHEVAEKAKRKKSLRFYTSQIVQKSNRRDNAGRDAGGDADLPYRERLREKQARLLAEAEARGKKRKPSGKEALGEDSDDEDRRMAEDSRGDGDQVEYYDYIASQTQKKKADKLAHASAVHEAEKQGSVVRVVEEVGTDGQKRAITYAIEKNKGITPKRKKEVRNSRVKKRKQYDEKKKKLGSVRQVYKGGEGRGGYGGELTGIKTNLVRSVKF